MDMRVPHGCEGGGSSLHLNYQLTGRQNQRQRADGLLSNSRVPRRIILPTTPDDATSSRQLYLAYFVALVPPTIPAERETVLFILFLLHGTATEGLVAPGQQRTATALVGGDTVAACDMKLRVRFRSILVSLALLTVKTLTGMTTDVYPPGELLSPGL
jgi:hypothetical protein